MRRSTFALVLSLAAMAIAAATVAAAAPPAGAPAPPRGKRTPRPRATHVVVAPAKLDTGAGVVAELRPGVAVEARGVRGAARGKVKVTLAGNVELAGTLDGSLLGLLAARDVEVTTPDGHKVLGRLREGAFVRATGAAAGGKVPVEAVGDVTLFGVVPADAVTAEPRRFAYSGTWSYRAAQAVDVYATPELEGRPIARLEAGARVEFDSQAGRAVKIETFGPVHVVGWVAAASLRERRDDDAPSGEAQLIAPTHEMFVDGPLFGDADGKKRAGLLRGGTVVEVIGAKPEATLVKINVPGDVLLTGWVRAADLRTLETRLFDRK